jgi:hypothetical protein
MMGEVCLSATGFAGSCKSYAKGTVEKGANVRGPAASERLGTGAEADVGSRIRRAHPEHTCRKAGVDDVRPIMIADEMSVCRKTPNSTPRLYSRRNVIILPNDRV